MQLEGMWIHGFRRFGGPDAHRLRLDGRLVCLVGANEVGKSTLLDALELGYPAAGEDADAPAPISPLDLTRGEDVPDERSVVRLRYRLNREELVLLSALPTGPQLTAVRWLEVEKRADGGTEINPVPVPVRDKGPRYELAEVLKKATERDDWPSDESNDDDPAAIARIERILEMLTSNYYALGTTLAALRSLADHLERLEFQPRLVARLREVADVESRPHPRDEALEVLRPLVPRFVRFDEAVRNLGPEYDLGVVAAEPPVPLANLARLGGLDVDAVQSRIEAGETGTVQDMLDSANAQLAVAFEAWTQEPPIAVRFDHSGSRLFVHVKSGAGASMQISERSDGLRQFVALVALTAHGGHQVAPILLIDEIEMHLHYDAQADLIAVLEQQHTAAQVIYTTHSAASLPDDLGSSVRVIRGIGDRMASEIRQQFWSEDPGLGALLLAMGAGSLAYVPLRPAIIVEGGSDLVLLPSLLREAMESHTVGCQIVPGAATVPPQRIAGLDLQGVATAWVLDGDAAGEARRKFLIESGVDPDRIVLLKAGETPLDIEDFIDKYAYAQAVNAYANDVGAPSEMVFGELDLPTATCARHRSVEQWFEGRDLRPPSKTAIANKLIDVRPAARLLEPQRKRTLRKVFRQATDRFPSASLN